jgi:aryl-alcohol dehydrogenase-like predicted oxidoreductase
LDASLKRLRTDYIDLYQLHLPDESTPVEETLQALDKAVHAGKIRYIGFANHTAAELARVQEIALSLGLTRPISSEDEYSILARHIEGEYLSVLKQHGMGLLPYFPLANGFLTGKFVRGAARSPETRLGKVKFLADRYMTPETWDVLDTLQALALEHGHTLLEYAIGWLLSKPVVATVVAGATRPEHVAANAAASDVELSTQEIAAIDRIRTSIGRFNARATLEYEQGLNLRDPNSYLRPLTR